MRRRKAIGYLVDTVNYGGMICVRGLLYFGEGVTLFAVRRLASKAINATINDRPNFEKDFGQPRIRRVYDWQKE